MDFTKLTEELIDADMLAALSAEYMTIEAPVDDSWKRDVNHPNYDFNNDPDLVDPDQGDWRNYKPETMRWYLNKRKSEKE